MRYRIVAPLLFLILVFLTACQAATLVDSEAAEGGQPSVDTAATSTPTSTPDPFPNPVAAVVGAEEIVFDWTTDRCEGLNLPDLPSRAFKDSNGQVQLIISNNTNYRMIGDDLNSVEIDCNAVSHSTYDADPSMFSDNEWISSLYTEDGQTIVALVHDEYQGHTHPGKCPQGEYFPCWYNTVTLAISTDSGETFEHAVDPPGHLVASLPVQYKAGDGPNGIRAPSNIIKGKDGFYYSFLSVAEINPSEQWVCLMRTDDLADPKAWRFWDGSGFEGQFINPYVDEGEIHNCPPLEWDNIGASLSDSITYNTYLDRYVLIGISADQLDNREVWGVFYSFSDDLVHWSRRKLLLEMPLPWTVAHHTYESNLYPSLLDPSSESRNFETTDKTAYLYFTRLYFGQSNLDRDLIRVPVEFFPRKEDIPQQEAPAEPTPVAQEGDLFDNALGDWASIDPFDQSRQILTLEKTSDEDYLVTIFDDGATMCEEYSNGNVLGLELVGTGQALTDTLRIENASLTCLTDPRQAAGSVTFTITYDSNTDTLDDSFDTHWDRTAD